MHLVARPATQIFFGLVTQSCFHERLANLETSSDHGHGPYPKDQLEIMWKLLRSQSVSGYCVIKKINNKLNRLRSASTFSGIDKTINMEHGAWSMEHATWNVERGTWNEKRGTWNVGREIWNVERKTRNVERGTRNVNLEASSDHGHRIYPKDQLEIMWKLLRSQSVWGYCVIKNW